MTGVGIRGQGMPSAAVAGPVSPRRAEELPLLLVEDDEGDAFLVTELLLEADIDWPVEWVRNLGEAAAVLRTGVRCVLLDLGLPDAADHSDGLGALHDLLDIAPKAPVLVLTGLDDQARGAAAVFAGAQDYLVKGQVDGHSLARAVRYAVERRRADEAGRRLREAELVQGENTRLTRGLLPQPQLLSADLQVESRYTPGERRLVLGGDFYDAVELTDGRLHLLVGDVSGHGPDEAALGVHLRVAWRALVLAELAPERVLPILEDILVRERRTEEVFATVCQLVVAADRRSADLWLAGHPVPVLLEPQLRPLAPEDTAGPPLGAVPGLDWHRTTAALDPPWVLALHSDGLIEGFAVPPVGADIDQRQRLGLNGLLEIIADLQRELRSPTGGPPDDSLLLEEVIRIAEEHNGGPMADDLAVLLVREQGGT